MNNSPFIWNGGFLGTINKTNILGIYNGHNNQKIYDISFLGYRVMCYGKYSKNTHPCICDELKGLFNQRKIGTHWFRMGKSKIFIISKIRYNHLNEIQAEFRLNELTNIYNAEFRRQVREIYAFRDVLNISQNYERMINIRCPRLPILRPYPISYQETSINPERKNGISKAIMNKWFDGLSIPDILRDMFKITNEIHIDLLINKIRSKIQDIIIRIDKTQIWLENYIITRLHNQLGIGLENKYNQDNFATREYQAFNPGSYVPNSPSFYPGCFDNYDMSIITTPTRLCDYIPDEDMRPIYPIPVSEDVLHLF